MNKLEKKICIVTGGTGLIGQEIVNDFLRNGATVIFTFNKNISKAKKGRILANKSQIIELIRKDLNNNDYLMMKASLATGFNHIVNDLKGLN